MRTVERVQDILRDCLYSEEELNDSLLPESAVIVEGVSRSLGFHPERLVRNRGEIQTLIQEIVTDKFLKSDGGGFSFLNLCEDRSGELWTSQHSTVDDFVCLSIGCGMAGFCLPRNLWGAFPGGLPYIWFNPEA